jgi:hypothetical protein
MEAADTEVKLPLLEEQQLVVDEDDLENVEATAPAAQDTAAVKTAAPAVQDAGAETAQIDETLELMCALSPKAV